MPEANAIATVDQVLLAVCTLLSAVQGKSGRSLEANHMPLTFPAFGNKPAFEGNSLKLKWAKQWLSVGRTQLVILTVETIRCGRIQTNVGHTRRVVDQQTVLYEEST